SAPPRTMTRAAGARGWRSSEPPPLRPRIGPLRPFALGLVDAGAAFEALRLGDLRHVDLRRVALMRLLVQGDDEIQIAGGGYSISRFRVPPPALQSRVMMEVDAF